MGKRRLYDEDVHEVFSSFGVNIPVFFEALRYRQQLTPEGAFPYPARDMERMTGLTYKQQLRAHKILETTGWIQTNRRRAIKGGTITYFYVTEFARGLIKNTVRKRSMAEIKRNFVKSLGKKRAELVCG